MCRLSIFVGTVHAIVLPPILQRDARRKCCRERRTGVSTLRDALTSAFGRAPFRAAPRRAAPHAFVPRDVRRIPRLVDDGRHARSRLSSCVAPLTGNPPKEKVRIDGDAKATGLVESRPADEPECRRESASSLSCMLHQRLARSFSARVNGRGGRRNLSSANRIGEPGARTVSRVTIGGGGGSDGGGPVVAVAF